MLLRSRYSIALRLAITLAVILLAPPLVEAHERWFVPNSQQYPPRFALLFTPPVLLSIAIAFLGIGALWLLRRLVGGDNLFPRIGFLRYYDRSNQVIIAIQTAISLIAVAVGLHVFAPNLFLGFTPLGFILSGIEIFIAFTFISGLLTRVGALLLIALFLLAFLFAPPWAVLEQALFVGIGLYLLIMGRGLVKTERHREPLRYFKRYWPLAPIFLRVGVGTSLVVLAFTEKLINPDLAVAFLRDYPQFNVARLVGLTSFSDELFIYAAGTVELTIGLALIAGILPKVVIFGMFVPFNLPLPFLPPTELLGHLPIFAAMYVLLFMPPPADQERMIEEAEQFEHEGSPREAQSLAGG